MLEFNENMKWLLGGTFAALLLGTIVRIIALRNSQADLKRKRMGSLKVWWTLAVMMSLAVVFGIYGVATLLALAGILALREFLKLVGTERIGRPGLTVAFAAILWQYGLIVSGHSDAARTWLPPLALVLISIVRLTSGGTTDYVRTTSATFLGVMLLVFNVSHAALLFTLPDRVQPAVGMAGWFLFVVIITEMDDIFQALVGRLMGRHKVTPQISPNKTWEGCVGGMLTSIVLAFALAPWLTTFPPATTTSGFLITIGAGIVIFVAAFFGDINMSAIKRDVGVKDGSTILPGMGGVIDRIDSLTFTAPVFYYFVTLVLSDF